ncbi:MAG: sulfatase-like hydrolase/transferase [Rhodomicrobium sp.]|nr:sulfatase-like hydrolase/transferase [Rhodomicrobium sp.]
MRRSSGRVPNAPTGFPGYTGAIPKSSGTVAEVLRQNGYNTAAFGKWHLIPEWEESQVGPFDHWPTGMGFEHYFGFIGADTDHFGGLRNGMVISWPERIEEVGAIRSQFQYAAERRSMRNMISLERIPKSGNRFSDKCASKQDLERVRRLAFRRTRSRPAFSGEIRTLSFRIEK